MAREGGYRPGFVAWRWPWPALAGSAPSRCSIGPEGLGAEGPIRPTLAADSLPVPGQPALASVV
jgi:hypothetical protein